jgi:hypothetical protein
VAGLCEHGDEPSGCIRKNILTSLVTMSFSNNILHHGVRKQVNIKICKLQLHSAISCETVAMHLK